MAKFRFHEYNKVETLICRTASVEADTEEEALCRLLDCDLNNVTDEAIETNYDICETSKTPGRFYEVENNDGKVVYRKTRMADGEVETTKDMYNINKKGNAQRDN